jgi:hypothetical protein
METRHVSAYYTKRCKGHKGHYKRRYPKLSAVVDVDSHLFVGLVIDRGPKPDDLEFRRVVQRAYRRQRFDVLLGDAGYDAEGHHRFLRERLGVLSVIPPMRGRPPNSPDHLPQAHYRRSMAENWSQLKNIYGQRWQIETGFSMLKRLLGSALRSRRRHAIDREILLRVVTINLMIVWPVF